MFLMKSDFEKRNYMSGAIRSTSGRDFNGKHGWTGVIVSGSKSSCLPPNTIEKRLSQKSFETRKEATEFAAQYLERLEMNAK
jgi:hypothetical protein